MEFNDNAKVYTSDGKDAGSLHRVVMDPNSKKVTHLVVQKGLLFKEDKVVEVEQVASSSADQIHLKCSLDQLKDMSPFEVKDYEPVNTPVEAGRAAFPVGGVLYPSQNYQARVVREVKRTLPESLAALKNGSRVYDEDGAELGTIYRIMTDTDSGKVTNFIIEQGILPKAYKAIPIDWVREIDDEAVYLTIKRQKVLTLPEEQV
jgi:uncharacterized protein YrrD